MSIQVFVRSRRLGQGQFRDLSSSMPLPGVPLSSGRLSVMQPARTLICFVLIPLPRTSASLLPHPHHHNYSSGRRRGLEGIPCSLPRSRRPLLSSVLPGKDCLPHLSPLQRSPNDSGYFKGHNVVTVTERCGRSTMTPLGVPLRLFMSAG